MSFEDVILEKKDGVSRITINRPKVLNSFRSKTLEEMAAALEDSASDRTIGVIVIAGAGGKAFCAGGDIAEMRELNSVTGAEFVKKLLRVTTSIRNSGKPVIAMVNGFCLGGGHEIHLQCDLTIASDKSKFGQTGPAVGSVPVWAGTQILPRLVGEKKAREIVFLCKQYTAQEALEMGLVNAVVPEENLEEETGKWCARILELSPQALKIAKLSFNFESDTLYPSFLHGLELLRMSYDSAELKEGMSAFLEKRKPDFGKFRK
jgi:dihydroxynaphthoic acid synthetase